MTKDPTLLGIVSVISAVRAETGGTALLFSPATQQCTSAAGKLERSAFVSNKSSDVLGDRGEGVHGELLTMGNDIVCASLGSVFATEYLKDLEEILVIQSPE